MKKLFILFIISFYSNILSESQLPQWNILIYMDRMEDLHSAAFQNITDAMAGFKGNNAQVFIQVHSDGESSIAYRYHLEAGKLTLDTKLIIKDDLVKNIIASAAWAFKHHAQHYGLVFWNHGFGILDPSSQEVENEEKLMWQSEPDHHIIVENPEHRNHRGIFLNSAASTYLNNQQMIQVMAALKYHILNGKKLDFLGTDTCGMAMLEIAWQIKDYVSYLIGAQNCALKDGWPYQGILLRLSTSSHTPKQCVKTIIEEYAKYYQQTSAESYTQAALDLSKIEYVKKNLDTTIKVLSELNPTILKTIAFQARQRCPIFCIHPTYTDLWTFYDELIESFKKNHPIRALLKDGKKLIEKAVTSYTTGQAMKRAHGISIYFPYAHIDSSYIKTQFALESLWVSFLKKLVD